jgi:hypothetical protein
MKSKCVDCSNFNSCTAASVEGAYMVSCPDYKKGKINPCVTMRLISDKMAVTKTVTKRKTKKEVKQSKNDSLSHVLKVFAKLPKLFNATDYKETSIRMFGNTVPLTRDIKKSYLKPDGKGHYINDLSKV